MNRLYGSLERRLNAWTAALDRLPLLAWLPICWALCWLAAQFLPVFWAANDDIAMSNLANGRVTGMPEWQLVFINPLWGLLLKGLYSITTRMPWYPWLFVFMQGFGWALYFRATGLLSIGWQKWAWAFAIWAGLSVYVLLHLQFTSAAAFPAVSALLFAMAQVRLSQSAGQLLRRVWPALLCFWLSWLVRKEALYLVIAIAVPFFIWLLFAEKKVWQKMWPALAVLAVLCGSAIATEKFAYSSPQWQYFKEYNWMRGQLQDARQIPFEADPALMQRMGWDQVDHFLFYFFRQDREARFGLGPVSMLYEQKGKLVQPMSLREKVAAEWKQIQFYGWPWTRFGFAALALLALGVRRRLDLLAVAGTIAAALGVAGAFIAILILKDRVLICLLFQGVATSFFIAFYHARERSTIRLGGLVVGLVLGALSAKAALSQGYSSLRLLRQTYVYLPKLQAPNRLNPILDFYSGMLGVNDPFGHYRLPSAYKALQPIPTGWLSFSPFQARAMRRMGWKPDSSLFVQAARDPRATFLLDPLGKTYLEEYLRRHLSPRVGLEPIGAAWRPEIEKAAQYRVVFYKD